MRIALASLVSIGCSTQPSAVDARIDHDASPDAMVDAKNSDAQLRAAVLGSCGMVTGAIGFTAEVTDTTGYVPTINVTIKVGQVARFGYADAGTEHTIVSGEPGMADGLFASEPFSNHGTLICVRFDAPGMYPIHCDRHPTGLERGTVTVEP